MSFSDIHSHFVYGVDDGAQTRTVMEQMLDMANAEGLTDLVSTPHVTPGLKPLNTERYLRHFEEARAYCRQMDYPIRLYTGA